MTPRQPGSAENYVGAFMRVRGLLPGAQAGWLQTLRNEAMTRFMALGFPDRHDEDWRHTPLKGLEQARFNFLTGPSPGFLGPRIAAHALPGAHLLVFVNGRLEPGLCRIGRLPKGVRLASLAYLLDNQPDALEPLLTDAREESPFTDLNLAFMADGFYLRVPAGIKLESPVHCLNITSEGNPAIQSRNLIDAGPGSHLRIVEQHIGTHDPGGFTNAVTEIRLAGEAEVEHYKVQQENNGAFHIATVNVAQQAKSRFASTSFALGARLSRVAIHAQLQAEQASCRLDGFYFTEGRRHADHHLRIDHRQPRCTSRTHYKGILDDASHAVFNARVNIHPQACGSDARQSNHNLLLSDAAEIDTQPQLDIRNDDVQCSHGATVAQLDAGQVFYLRTRGLDEGEAQRLLTHAFALEMIEQIHLSALQEQLDGVLRQLLPQRNHTLNC